MKQEVFYSLSSHFNAIKIRELYFCYNSLMGTYGVVDIETFNLFNFLKNSKRTKKEICNFINQKEEEIDDLLDAFNKDNLIVLSTKEREESKIANKLKKKQGLSRDNMHFLGFNVIDDCNFSCSYCIKKKCDDLWSLEENKSLTWDVAQKRLDDFIELALSNKKRKVISIGFGGGEPLLNFDLIKKIVEYTNKKLTPKKRVNFFITTNGVLINAEIAKFFATNNFIQVGISLDGNKIANNNVRKYADGRDTYSDIFCGLEKLLQYFPSQKTTISTTMSNGNFKQINNNFLKKIRKLGIKKLSLEPDLIDFIDHDYNKISSKIFNLYKYAKKIDLMMEGYWKKPFSSILSRKTSIGACFPVKAESISITPDGKIKPCIYSEDIFPGESLKKINELPKYRRFVMNNWIGNIEECKGCEIEGVCLGGCYISRIMPDKRVFEYRCALYKKLFHLLVVDFIEENYQETQKMLGYII